MEELQYNSEYGQVLIDSIEHVCREERCDNDSITWTREPNYILFKFKPTQLTFLAKIFREYGKRAFIKQVNEHK